MKALILTEGGRNIGFGHVTRCLSLYQALEEAGISSEFVVNGDETLNDVLKCKYRTFEWLKDKYGIYGHIKNSGNDVVILDSYLADSDFYGGIPELTKIAVYLDDNNRLVYPKGIVVNGSIYADKLDYPKGKDVRYLLGSGYTPIRKEFWDVPEKKVNDGLESVMITLGGYDAKNMAPSILKIICDGLPDAAKRVVIGKGAKNIDEIKKATDMKTDLLFSSTAKEILDVMLNSDIAVSAAGQTLNELARVGVPTVAVAVADNQVEYVKRWRESGFIEYAGQWDDKDIYEKVAKCVNLLRDKKRRAVMSNIGRGLVDGKGPRRVVREIAKDLQR